MAISVWGYGMAQMMAQWPQLPTLMKAISAVYLAFLAMRLWQTASTSANGFTGRISAPHLFVATLLNPKALLFATAVFPVVAWQTWAGYVTVMLEFVLLALVAASCWIALGTSLRQAEQTWLQPAHLQRVAACVLSVFAIGLLWSVWPVDVKIG